MLQSDAMVPLIERAVPQLTALPFRLAIDTCASQTALAAAGALLTSVGNVFKQTQLHESPVPGLQTLHRSGDSPVNPPKPAAASAR